MFKMNPEHPDQNYNAICFFLQIFHWAPLAHVSIKIGEHQGDFDVCAWTFYS